MYLHLWLALSQGSVSFSVVCKLKFGPFINLFQRVKTHYQNPTFIFMIVQYSDPHSDGLKLIIRIQQGVSIIIIPISMIVQYSHLHSWPDTVQVIHHGTTI